MPAVGRLCGHSVNPSVAFAERGPPPSVHIRRISATRRDAGVEKETVIKRA